MLTYCDSVYFFYLCMRLVPLRKMLLLFVMGVVSKKSTAPTDYPGKNNPLTKNPSLILLPPKVEAETGGTHLTAYQGTNISINY